MNLRRIAISLSALWFSVSLSQVLLPEAVAGGFYLAVEQADASVTARAPGAVLVVRPYGCHQPSDAELTATAEGFVNGKRESVPLKLAAIDHGVYAISQQWGSDGVWVVAIRGKYNKAICSALVQLGANGKVALSAATRRLPVRIIHRDLSAAEIDSVLRNPQSRVG
jgi:hypothetical protein